MKLYSVTMAFISATRFILFLLFISCSGTLWCQSASGAAEDRVQSLYSDAKSAETAGDLATAVSKYQEILKLQPRLAAAYNNLGALYFKQGDYRQAAVTLERGLNLDPHMTTASALLGISLFQMGEYERARPRLEAALKANPTDNNAEFLLVNDLTKLSDFEEAAVHLQRLAARNPGNQHIWYLLGRVYMQLSQQALAKVNEIDPNSVWAHEISAELMESMKNYDGAIVEWKKAIDAAPDQPGVHFKLGDLYWSLSQWDNAANEFQIEQKIDPHNCMVDWKLGDIELQKNGDLEQGLARVNKALTSCPNLTEAHADRGRLLLKLHRDADAIPELQFVAKNDPAEPSTHFLLAQA